MIADAPDPGSTPEPGPRPGSDSLDPLGATPPLASLIALFSALSSSSLHREFVRDPDFPVDPNALPLLIDLALHGAQRPGEIADQLHVSAATAGRVVQRLVVGGFVSRETDPADGRAALVRLTPEGRRMVREVLLLGDDFMGRVLLDWNPEERTALASTLARLTGDVARALQRRPFGEAPSPRGLRRSERPRRT